MVELLAPAGDLEKFKIAIDYGADACFIGGQEFSLRARASNFTIDDIEKACDYAHKRGKKVYVTTNIIPHEDDLKNVKEYLIALDNVKVDAIIVASLYIASIATKYTNLEVHISTQNSSSNSNIVNLFSEKYNASRVVLAREMSLDEIKACKANSKTELEVFIHGGTCMSYSGRCSLSNYMANRDANRGGCAHSCRWGYELFYKKQALKDSFSLSSKDLCAIRSIPALIDIGVKSLKIEGRMKSLHYIATVVGTYRKLIDEYSATQKIDSFEIYENEILKAENRLTYSGMFNGIVDNEGGLYNMRSERVLKNFVGIIKSYDAESGYALIEQRNFFTKNTKLEIFSVYNKNKQFECENIYDDAGNLLDAARHPRQLVKIKVPFKVYTNDILRIALESKDDNDEYI